MLMFSMELRWFARDRHAAAFESIKHRRNLRQGHLGLDGVEHHQIRTLADRDSVVPEPHQLGWTPRDHVEAFPQAGRTTDLTDIGVKIRYPNERAIPEWREWIEHIVARQRTVHSMAKQFVGWHHTPWLIVVVNVITPHQVKVSRRQHGERHAHLRQPLPHPFQLRERQARRLGDVADGYPSPVFVLLGPPTDVPDIHLVAGGPKIEMHVDVDVELARHLEHPVDL